MFRAKCLAPYGILLLAILPVVLADGTTGVVVASSIAGALLICLLVGLAIFCFYKRNGLNSNGGSKHKKKKKKHVIYMAENGHPPYYEKRPSHKHNGYNQPVHIQRPPPYAKPVSAPVPVARPPVQLAHPAHYATYHGPPPAMQQYAPRSQPGTMSGPPPPIVIPYGTVSVRPDPRPVIHKASRKREDRDSDPRRHSPTRHRSPERKHDRHQSQEFVIQQSYDGIPVIRPVIYVDDDDDHTRTQHRSKSRDRRFKKHSSQVLTPAKITEIKMDSAGEFRATTQEETPVTVLEERPMSTSPEGSRHVVRSAERSRASSVTEAVRALRESVQDHLDGDTDSTSSSKAPSFNWAHTERAPDPAAGDVMFFAAGTHVDDTRHEHAIDNRQSQRPDETYGYTKQIKHSIDDDPPKIHARDSRRVSPQPGPSAAFANEGYEIPLTRSTKGTRDQDVNYETEHSRQSGVDYSHIGASMSDHLQNLVETGDKSRFSQYNVGAINFGEEEEEIDGDQLRVRRPETPPDDTDHIYAKAIKRPASPPNDIPITARESTEIPPLNLRSAVGSPSESMSYRPPTPPKDFPITPHSSFMQHRPRTPPTDFPMTPTAQRPATPPFDASTDRPMVAAVDPTSGQPGTFQDRRKFIEAHLLKNVGGNSAAPAPKPKTTYVPSYKSTPAPAPPAAPAVHITPGVIPPPPPPPPIKA